MDCNKDFPGETYVQHTQCITESEKYFGSHHVAKVGKDKNEVWMTTVRERLAAQTGLKPFVARLVARILALPNIPRKKAKFENFLKTSMNMVHQPIVDELWLLVSEAGERSNKENKATNEVDSPPPAPHQSDQAGGEEQQTNGDDKKEKKKKRKRETNVDEESEEIIESSSGDTEPKKKKKKKRKAINGDQVFTEATSEQEGGSDESSAEESKSARRRRRTLHQSATEEPDPLAPARRVLARNPTEQERDMADYEDISVDTVHAEKNFKWRRTLKKLIREAPSEGIKIPKLLNKIDQLHNHPLSGASQPLPKETLQTILMKLLARKPFIVINGRVCIGKASKN